MAYSLFSFFCLKEVRTVLNVVNIAEFEYMVYLSNRDSKVEKKEWLAKIAYSFMQNKYFKEDSTMNRIYLYAGICDRRERRSWKRLQTRN